MSSMYVTLKEILKNPIFSEVDVLAGKDGLTSIVERISVFDCTCDKNLVDKGILKEGDLFISCLEQFNDNSKQTAYDFFQTIIKYKSSGLFVVGDEGLHNLSEEIISLCNREMFPVIHTSVDMPYAMIMDAVNQYIAIDNVNALNTLKLEKILYGGEDDRRNLDILNSINPNIKQYLRVIEVDGEFTSDIARMDMHIAFLKSREDVFVRSSSNIVFILSADDEYKLKHHSNAVAIKFKEFMKNPTVGYSRMYKRKDIKKALEEGRRALETAKAMMISDQIYEPMSVLQLLLVMKDTQEASDFYDAYVEAVSNKVSADSLKDILKTMETYVANSGSFCETAKVLNQHENTIRYRVNKVKSALDMEDDNVKFYETIAIAVKLRTILGVTM